MSMRLGFSALLLLSLIMSSVVYSKQPSVDLVASITAKGIAEHIEVLASDEFEGRLPGSKGEQLTIDYISTQFKQIGLDPGKDGDYLEPVTLIGTKAASRPIFRFNNGDNEVSLEFGSEFIAGSDQPDGNLAIDNLDAVFVGYGFDTPERDDFKSVDVQGKAVFFLWGDPPKELGAEAELNPRTANGMRQTKYLKAMEKGAVAAFAIHNQKAAGYPWEVLGKTDPQWSYRLQGAKRNPDFSGMVSSAAAEKLFPNYQALVDLALGGDFEPIEITNAVSLEFTQESKKIESNNVVGLLRSEQPSDEYFLYCAHWDHMGKSGNGEDKILNGAVDNATGTAAILTIAKTMAKAKKDLSRNIIFFATTAEEQGLLGAYAYTNAPVYPLEKTVGVINIDSIFPFGEGGGMTVTGYGNSELEEFLRESAELEGRALQPESQPEFGGFFRSDHFPFVVKGVPSLFAVGGPTDEEFTSNEELQEKYADFGQNKYHKAADEYHPDEWDMGGIVQDVKIHFRTGYAIATDPRIPNWYLNSEFRALRDQEK